MSNGKGKTTAPGTATTGGEVAAPLCLALVVAWSASQPHLVGHVAFFPFGEPLFIGRGNGGPEKFSHPLRQRPGETPALDPRDGFLTGDTLSRQQLLGRSTGDMLEMEQVGRCRTFFNGEERQRATLRPGDTVMFKAELVLLCVERPRTLPRLRSARGLHEFGEPDAAGIVGESPAAWRLRDQIALAAEASDHVLIQGESGTGKELAAAALHKWSQRASRAFVSRNAATFTTSLLASELFGNAADYPNHGMPARKGLVGAADRGTLFLDEIGVCALDTQTQLLRLMDHGEYQTLGESTTRRVDLRLVGATNRDDSVFLPDFLARFQSRVGVPPLRERREDIPLILRHLLLERARQYPAIGHRFLSEGPGGRIEPRFSARFIDYVVRQPLATNVRELNRFLLRAIDASDGDEIRMPSAQPPSRSTAPSAVESDGPSGSPSRTEVAACLERERGNVARTAKALGLSRSALYRLMQAFGIKNERGR